MSKAFMHICPCMDLYRHRGQWWIEVRLAKVSTLAWINSLSTQIHSQTNERWTTPNPMSGWICRASFRQFSLHYITLHILHNSKPFRVKSYTDNSLARSAAPCDDLATNIIMSFSTSKCISVIINCLRFITFNCQENLQKFMDVYRCHHKMT